METNSNIEPRLQTGCAQPYVAVAIELILNERVKTSALTSEITEWVNNQGLKIAGPLFYRYYVIEDAEKPFQIEVGFPVSAFVRGNGRVMTGYIPDGTFATLMHCGHLDNIGQSFEKLQNWVIGQGIQFRKYTEGTREIWDGRFEFLMNADEPDLNKWRIAIALLIDG